MAILRIQLALIALLALVVTLGLTDAHQEDDAGWRLSGNSLVVSPWHADDDRPALVVTFGDHPNGIGASIG